MCVAQGDSCTKDVQCTMKDILSPVSRQYTMVCITQFDMAAKLWLAMTSLTSMTERGDTIIDDNIFDNDDEKKDNSTILHAHKTKDNTIGMMGQMNIKLPTPTQFDQEPTIQRVSRRGQSLPHNTQCLEDYVNKCTKSIENVNMSDIQDEHTADDVT
eukprot:1808773-Amphidinium_carterae.1